MAEVGEEEYSAVAVKSALSRLTQQVVRVAGRDGATRVAVVLAAFVSDATTAAARGDVAAAMRQRPVDEVLQHSEGHHTILHVGRDN